MILSDRHIRSAQNAEQGGVKIEPFIDKLVQPASYDLRVGNQAASSAGKKVIDVEKAGFVEIKPGDFVIVITAEFLALDAQHVGRFGLTSSYARKGLIATVGTQIDPGFNGRLTVGLTNFSNKSIVLPHEDTFLTAEFHRLARPVEAVYSGPYQNRDKLSSEDIKLVMEREYMSQTEMMRTLEALVLSVKGLERTINWHLPMMGIIMAVGIATIIFLAKFL